MNKKFMGLVVALVVSLSFMTVNCYAKDQGGGKEHGKADGHKWKLEDKFMHKVHFILSNQDELGMSDEQVQKIKELKIETKKDLIRTKADIEILSLDIKSELSKSAINAKTVKQMIDKKYGLKSEKAKALVDAYATLKGMLPEEQKRKMKELWKKSKKEMVHCPMMKGKMSRE